MSTGMRITYDRKAKLVRVWCLDELSEESARESGLVRLGEGKSGATIYHCSLGQAMDFLSRYTAYLSEDYLTLAQLDEKADDLAARIAAHLVDLLKVEDPPKKGTELKVRVLKKYPGKEGR